MPEWIPRKIMPDVLRAIDDSDRSSHVFYITSRGGEGKTILLRQIGMKLGSPDGVAPHFPWSGILDLYHPDVNTNSGLEARLSQALETADEFQPFRDARKGFTERRDAGLTGHQLEVERERMAGLFANGVNRVTHWSRVVIALDTTERIQYEVDRVQKLCQMEDESTTVRAWLLEQLSLWENCVVLLVGRPEADPYLEGALARALARNQRVRYEARTLGGFDEDEAREYFAKKEINYPALRVIDSDFRQRLWDVAAGSPIRLDLAVEVILRGLGFDKFQKRIREASAEEAREEIDRLLIEEVMNGDPSDSVRKVLRYLAVARRGLDARLLHHLAGEWDLNTCQANLKAVAERSFVKQHPEEESLFLHDEMYRLCDNYLLSPEEVQRLSRSIVEWYEEQINASSNKRSRQGLMVESMPYRLRANPREGYHWYVWQAESAIRAAEVGFEMRLRNEVRAFLTSKSPIDKRFLRNALGLVEEFDSDSAARWVKRLMVRGESVRAVQAAERAGPVVCPPDDPRFELAWADLAVYHAQALIYTGHPEKAVDLLRKTLDRIEGGQKPEELALLQPKTYEGLRQNLMLGRGHNNLGYAHWMHFGHYDAALREFRSAIPYFHSSELLEEMANTNDNMGRVYALRRHPTRAETLVDEGLALRRKLGHEYRIGLSLNSRAIVHLEFEEPHRARRRSEEALSIFEGLQAQRGIGLALITLGRSLRHLGKLWMEGVYSSEDCEEFFSLGAQHLSRANLIFEKDVDEPVRRVEALNELGCLYRDRARLAQGMSPGASVTRAIGLLKGCIDLAHELRLPIAYVDSCEDLAQTYFLRCDYDNTRQWLEYAMGEVPEIYRFKEGEQYQDIPEEERIEAFWLQLGKIELLSGNLAFDLGTEGGSKSAPREVLAETGEHYLLAAAYFEKYSERAVGLRTAFRQMYGRFKHSTLDELVYLQKEALPQIAAKYGIDLFRLGRFFEDTLGLVLEWQP